MADYKLPTAYELPSHSWRCRVYDKELKKQVSFTSKLKDKAGKNEAELMAREYLAGKREKREKGKTVGECIDEYINLKENILSPTTIAEYRRCKKSELISLCDMYLTDLTANDVQELVNKLALTKKPKTVRNAHGLLASVLNVYLPDLRLRTTLPKPQKKFKELPSVDKVLNAIIGTDIELPCMLAIWCGFRMSEIRGIKHSDIKNGILKIHRTKLCVEGHDVVRENTKTFDSTRLMRLPQYILDLIDKVPKDQEFLVPWIDNTIYCKLQRLLKKAGITEHMSFHDLRHMNASVMLALKIPDKYAMERGGWSSPAIMKNVYQHTFSAERDAVDAKIDNFFTAMIDKRDETFENVIKKLDTPLDTTAI